MPASSQGSCLPLSSFGRCPIFLCPSFGPWSALARTLRALARTDKYAKCIRMRRNQSKGFRTQLIYFGGLPGIVMEPLEGPLLSYIACEVILSLRAHSCHSENSPHQGNRVVGTGTPRSAARMHLKCRIRHKKPAMYSSGLPVRIV